jgi:glycosyltransferase involved in cell wall biosynthesis
MVQHHPSVDEVIVIDDGSTDGTDEVIQRYPGVTLIRHEKNKGKTQAILTGIGAATGELLFFMDADLIGVTREAITRLVEPVANGSADMTITLRKNSLLVYRLLGCDFVSGERVFPRKLLQNLESDVAKLPPFGFEVYINRLALDQGLAVKIIPWDTVITPAKTKKRGLVPGLIADVGMIKDIFQVITPLELLQQNYFLAGFK